MMKNELRAEMFPLGESGILIEFGKEIHPDIHRKIKTLAKYLDEYPFTGMTEYVLSFTSITVFYNPIEVRKIKRDSEKGKLSYEIVEGILEGILSKLNDSGNTRARVVEIPVCYGGDFGPDLEYVAEYNKITVDEVIKIHSSAEYLVYMIGFAPGFPYLGGMSEKIETPRRKTPRTLIPPGTVGIAGMQTGVYPIGTPGGWQLIGSTPLELFRPNECPPSLLQSGDIIRFCPISFSEYEQYRREQQ
ncbi:5-oxoprolinase subunit PxpB [Clostridium sp. A1-XYC3]|uniref:5-oxoprolinase subunit PxpB n=1 Tax=Clostridium tanneri TaxID=3037988 RepID=A0ABU4JTJ3_9CLOT|nr:5-oxoprolinase subunit PxpB [Clostridium sp. A1-XYC3]MDW8801485.1 5-oxoprolinase subunit PxpB [Clostridium sp. A1-XYC3]